MFAMLYASNKLHLEQDVPIPVQEDQLVRHLSFMGKHNKPTGDPPFPFANLIDVLTLMIVIVTFITMLLSNSPLQQ